MGHQRSKETRARNRSWGAAWLLVVVSGLLAVPRSASAALLGNPGFETPATAPGASDTFSAGSTAMAPWVIVSGSVDVVNTGYWPSFAGQNSIDLAGVSPGTISQTFATTAGTQYELSFRYANNGDVLNAGLVAKASVTVSGSASLLSNTITHTGSTLANMNYTQFTQAFTADASSATLRFTDTTGNNVAGTVLDEMSVTGRA